MNTGIGFVADKFEVINHWDVKPSKTRYWEVLKWRKIPIEKLLIGQKSKLIYKIPDNEFDENQLALYPNIPDFSASLVDLFSNG